MPKYTVILTRVVMYRVEVETTHTHRAEAIARDTVEQAIDDGKNEEFVVTDRWEAGETQIIKDE